MSPCGAAVEWARFASVGTWRLYRNNLARLTRGRFFRVAEDVPFLPFPHPFFSASWSRGDPSATWTIGPVSETPATWTTPELGIPAPPAIPLGQRLQFENPTFVDQSNANDTRAGIPVVCWTDHNFPFQPWEDFLAIEEPALQTMYVRIVEQLYTPENRPRVEEAMRRWFGFMPHIEHINQNGEVPNIMVVRTSTVAMVFITGTDNFEQAATQAWEGGLPPRNYGAYSSLPIWSRTADLVFERMIAMGIPGDLPIVITGHSYGGAVGANITARIRTSNPTRPIALLDFGMPAPGAEDTRRILEKTRHVPLVNRGDLVTIVPLNPGLSLPFAPLVPAVQRFIWGEWKNPKTVQLIEEDGTKTIGPNQSPSYDVLLPIILRLITGQPLNIGVPHSSTEYYRRLLLRQRLPAWPVPEDVWQQLVDQPVPIEGFILQFGLAEAP